VQHTKLLATHRLDDILDEHFRPVRQPEFDRRLQLAHGFLQVCFAQHFLFLRNPQKKVKDSYLPPTYTRILNQKKEGYLVRENGPVLCKQRALQLILPATFHLAALTLSHNKSSCEFVTPPGLHLAKLSAICTLL